MGWFGEKFGEAIILWNGPFNWLPSSYDLTPFDYFLWGYIKSKIYLNKPKTIAEFGINIQAIIAVISTAMLHRIIENWNERIDVCKKCRDGYLSDILFKSQHNMENSIPFAWFFGVLFQL